MIIVIGGGIVGASAAYHLAKLNKKVTLVDRFDVGQATDAAAGIVCPWISQRRNKAWYELVKGGARYYPTLIEQLKDDGEEETGYKKVGAISLHTDFDKLEKMAERARLRKEDALEIGEIKILSSKETKALFPPIAEGVSSVFISGGARVNGRALRDALINAAKKNGAEVINGDGNILVERGKIQGVKVNGKIIEVETVLITGGAWARELLKQASVNIDITPQKAQIVHLQLMNNISTNNAPVIMPPNNQYIVPFENGKVVIGATHEDNCGFDTRVTAGGLQEIFSKALEFAPGLTDATVLETRVGFRPFTPGFLPIIGAVPGLNNAFIANGLGASGLTSGPYLGAELARLALGLKTELNLDSYDVKGALKKE